MAIPLLKHLSLKECVEKKASGIAN